VVEHRVQDTVTEAGNQTVLVCLHLHLLRGSQVLLLWAEAQGAVDATSAAAASPPTPIVTLEACSTRRMGSHVTGRSMRVDEVPETVAGHLEGGRCCRQSNCQHLTRSGRRHRRATPSGLGHAYVRRPLPLCLSSPQDRPRRSEVPCVAGGGEAMPKRR